MNAISLLDRLIPHNIHSMKDLMLLTRARVLVAFSIMYLFSTFFIAIIISIVNLMGILTLWSGAISSTISFSLYSLTLFYFYRTGNIQVATHCFLAILTLATVAFITITAGWTSPVNMILMCVATCAFLMQGRVTGILWSAIITAIYVTYYVLYKYGVDLPQVVDASLLDLLALFSWMYAWAIMFGGVLLYSSMANQLSLALSRERSQLQEKATYDSVSGAYKREAFIRLLRAKAVESDKPGNAFLMLDVEVIAKGILSRDDEVEIQQKIYQAITKAFPGRTTIAKSSGMSFLVMIDQANNDAVAAKIIDFLIDTVHKTIDAGLVAVTTGAVMVPGYSSDVDEVLVTARRAIQEAHQTGQAYVLYSQARRIRLEKWTPKHWVQARFAEVTGQATH